MVGGRTLCSLLLLGAHVVGGVCGEAPPRVRMSIDDVPTKKTRSIAFERQVMTKSALGSPIV